MQAIKTDVDCCSLNGVIISDNIQHRFINSMKYKSEGDGVHHKHHDYLSVVRRSIVEKTIYSNDDLDYSDRLLPLLKTEATIDGELYFIRKN